MEELSKKIKGRGGHRGYVTQLLAQLEETADETTLREIEEQLQKKREVLKRLDEEILEIISGDIEDEGELCSKEISESGTLQRRKTAALLKIQGLFTFNSEGQKSLRRESVLSADSLGSYSSSSAGSKCKSRAKLPKLELKKFSGCPIDWPEFWDAFRIAVDDNEEISEVDKFSYLQHYLEEPAKKVISGFPLTEAKYGKAL